MAETELSRTSPAGATRVAVGASAAALVSVWLLCWSPPASGRHTLSACVQAGATCVAPPIVFADFSNNPTITGPAVGPDDRSVSPSLTVDAVVAPLLNRKVSLSRFGGLYGP
jgi:hypothetical protein